MKKPNAYTLIELLAIIAILGLILAVISPGISAIIRNSYNNAYQIHLSTMKSATKNYIFKNNIVVNEGERRIVSINQLEESGFSKIIDPATNENCDGYIEVLKEGNKYSFVPYLKCAENFESDNYGDSNLIAPTITIIGDNPVNIYVGDEYEDAGATALDDVEGDITNKIVVTGNVNVNIPGTYTVTYSVPDVIGNVTVKTRTVNVIDNENPTFTFEPNGNTSYVKRNTTIVHIIDTGKIVKSSMRYAWSISLTTPAMESFTEQYVDYQAIKTPYAVTGEYYLWLMASDVDGNTSIERSNVFKLDNEKPVITINGNNNITIDANNIYTDLGATVTDNVDVGITPIVTSNVNPCVVGTYNITYDAVDSSGNIAASVTRTVNVVDISAPIITVLGNNPSTLQVGSVYSDAGAKAVDFVNGDISSRIVVTGTINPNLLGSYAITYTVEDTSGNEAISVRTVNVVDTVVPTVAFGTNGNATYAKSRSTTVTVSDNYAVNTSSLKYLWSTSTTAPSEASFTTSFTNGGTINSPAGVTGGYYLWILGKDTSDNIKIQRTNIFNLDNTKPVITLTGSSPVNVNVGTTYTDAGATSTDAHSGLNGTVTSTGTVNVNVPGTYTVTYNVSDNAGNAATSISRTVNVIDNVAPTVAFGTNGNATYAKTRSTTVTISDAHSGLNTSSFKYLWNTSTTTPTEASFTTSFTNGATISSPASVTGGYYLWILAKDTAGNTLIQRTNVFNLDNTKPVITLTGNTTVRHEIGTTYTDAGATATDAHSGVAGAISVTSTVNVSVVGSYTVTYNVSDNASNAATTVTRTVDVVDTTAPTITTALAGNMIYKDPAFESGLNSAKVYNNAANGNVTITRVTISGAPVGRGDGLEIKTVGTASPGWGGFYFGTVSAANKVYVTKIIAKIPVGYTINWASNATGDGRTTEWLTSQAGTGDWEEYVFKLTCGSTGTFSSTNYYYLSGGATPTPTTPLIWHVAYATVYDTTLWGTSNNILFKATDGGSGITGYGVNQSSTTPPTYTTISSTASLGMGLDTDIITNGTYYVWVRDASGNASKTAVTVSYVERTNPTVVFGTDGGLAGTSARTSVTVSDAGGSGLNTSTLQYAWSTSSTSVPVSGWTTFTNGATLTYSNPGTYYLWIKGTDNAGNTAAIVSDAFKISNYGTAIQSSYASIYSSSAGLVSTSPQTYNYGNYPYIYGISVGTTSALYTAQASGYAYIYSGTNTYNFTRNTNTNRWIDIFIRGSGMTSSVYFQDFHLIFSDNASYTLTEAVTNGYIEPLVLTGSAATTNSSYAWSSIYNIVTGASSGANGYANAHIIFKVKNTALKGFSMYSSKAFNTTYDGWRAVENNGALDFSISSY